MDGTATRPAFWDEIRLLMFGAMTIFVYTIGIGVLNGTDLVDFDRRRVLGHVHGGTLGWLTLSVFAASLWLFGGERTVSRREGWLVRAMAVVALAAFAGYVTAFSLTYGGWRPATGTTALAAIMAFFAWITWRSFRLELSVPHLGFLAAMATSVVGGVLGVLWALEIATGNNIVPSGISHAHPGAMVLGFLTPIVFGMSEWALDFPNPPRATRAGAVQMAFLFIGGLVFVFATLASLDALTPVALLLQLGALGIFIRRNWGPFRQVRWLEASPVRYAMLSPLFSIFVLGLGFYFAIRYEGDFDLVPLNQGLALDHAQFIGGVTNSVFAMLLAATPFERQGGRVDQLVFVLVNAGLAGFAMGLLFDVTVMKRVFAPTMGAGLLIGLAVFAWRLAPGLQPAARADAPARPREPEATRH